MYAELTKKIEYSSGLSVKNFVADTHWIYCKMLIDLSGLCSTTIDWSSDFQQRIVQ